MLQYRFSRVAYALSALLVIAALLILATAVLRLDRPGIADTRSIASYSKYETHASTNAEDHATKQKPSQASSRSQKGVASTDVSPTKTPASVTRTSVSAATPDTGDHSQDLAVSKRSITHVEEPVNEMALSKPVRKPSENHEKVAKAIGKSVRKLPTWNARIGAPIFYRPSVERHFALSESRNGALGVSAKPVCRTLQWTSGNSRVVFPLPDEYLYSYEDTWGDTRVQGAHEGTDLMAPEGTPEYAITDSTLVPVAGANSDGWNTLGGYTVMLRADYDIGPIRAGDLFYYAHMREQSALPIGTHVQAGQVLGYVGDTGEGPEVTRGLFPPHLHLGWYDTSGLRTSLPSGAMNPYPLLQWLKANGGLISGGSSVRYCEAPQSEEPIPSTGARLWPASTSPGKMPDLDTGTNNAKPSPVVDHTFHASGRVLEHPETAQRRIVHKPVKHRVAENTHPVNTEARSAPSASHRVNASRQDATANHSHRMVSRARNQLARHHHEVRAILHKVEERVRALYLERLRGRIGDWFQPYRPTNSNERKTDHNDSKLEKRHNEKALKDHARHEKEPAGKGDPAKPEPAGNSGENDELPAEVTTCGATSMEECTDTDEEESIPASEPNVRNTDEPVTTSDSTESEAIPESDAAEQVEEVQSTNSEAVEASESASANPSENGESTVPGPEAEQAAE